MWIFFFLKQYFIDSWYILEDNANLVIGEDPAAFTQEHCNLSVETELNLCDSSRTRMH